MIVSRGEKQDSSADMAQNSKPNPLPFTLT